MSSEVKMVKANDLAKMISLADENDDVSIRYLSDEDSLGKKYCYFFFRFNGVLYGIGDPSTGVLDFHHDIDYLNKIIGDAIDYSIIKCSLSGTFKYFGYELDGCDRCHSKLEG